MSFQNITVEPARVHVAPFKPLTKEDVASLLGVTSRCVELWVEQGLLPRWRKLGNRCFWHPDVFFSWLDSYLKSTESLPSEKIVESPVVERTKKGRVADSTVGAANARRLARIVDKASESVPIRHGAPEEALLMHGNSFEAQSPKPQSP